MTRKCFGEAALRSRKQPTGTFHPPPAMKPEKKLLRRRWSINGLLPVVRPIKNILIALINASASSPLQWSRAKIPWPACKQLAAKAKTKTRRAKERGEKCSSQMFLQPVSVPWAAAATTHNPPSHLRWTLLLEHGRHILSYQIVCRVDQKSLVKSLVPPPAKKKNPVFGKAELILVHNGS